MYQIYAKSAEVDRKQRPGEWSELTAKRQVMESTMEVVYIRNVFSVNKYYLLILYIVSLRRSLIEDQFAEWYAGRSLVSLGNDEVRRTKQRVPFHLQFHMEFQISNSNFRVCRRYSRLQVKVCSREAREQSIKCPMIVAALAW